MDKVCGMRAVIRVMSNRISEYELGEGVWVQEGIKTGDWNARVEMAREMKEERFLLRVQRALPLACSRGRRIDPHWGGFPSVVPERTQVSRRVACFVAVSSVYVSHSSNK